MKKQLAMLLSLLVSLLLAWPAAAQTDETTYTVQIGDTLTRIALKYEVSVSDLVALNGIANPDLIVAGQQLRIPSGAGPAAPTTLAAPNTLDVTDKPEPVRTYTVTPGDTLFSIANRFGLTVTDLAALNGIADVNLIEVGQVLIVSGEQTMNIELPLSPPFETVTFSENPIIQGRTLVVYVTLSEPAELSVSFDQRPVFLQGAGQSYWGIVGMHALQPVGVYPLTFRAVTAAGETVTVAQYVTVAPGPYETQNIELLPGREALLDPQIVQAEAEKVSAAWNKVSPQPLWNGRFITPVDNDRITSPFGTRRSYNGGPATSFHGGTDYGTGAGVAIYAPAAGVVVLAEPLQVRGNAVIIDHGMGLFSGYWHQTEIAVHVGQTVAPGDLIGYVGDTGLVTGPHLHWEMRLGGIAVEPLQWLNQSIP